MVFWSIRFLLAWIEGTYPEVFLFWPAIIQGRVQFCSFGVVGECAKHAYAPTPYAHNAFFLTIIIRTVRSSLAAMSTLKIIKKTDLCTNNHHH